MKKDNKIKILTISLITAIIMAVSSITIYSNVCAPKFYDYFIDTGIKYLMDGKYEEAILAFNKAIEIEEKSTEARVFSGDGCPSGLAVYSTLFLGANAYGVTEVTGGGLETIVKQKGSAGAADPLNQRSTVGWKAMRTAEILVQPYMVRCESCSTFSSTTTAN